MSRNYSGRRLPSLCNDLVFKLLFSKHLHLLSDLINAVRYPLAPIVVRRILNPHILPEEMGSKEIVLDILAEDIHGQRLGIEMQLRRFLHWPERSVFGLARSLAGQLRAGQDYRDLRPSIGISLLVHDLFKNHPEKAAWHFTLRDQQMPHVQLGEALQLHIMELRKAERLRKLPGPLRAWIACLLHNLDEAAMSTITYPPVQEALKHLETMCSDEEFRLLVERREQALVDAEDALDYARHEGQRKGAAGVLEHQLSSKFGVLPEWARAHLEQADAAVLERWALRVLTAEHIEDVFS